MISPLKLSPTSCFRSKKKKCQKYGNTTHTYQATAVPGIEALPTWPYTDEFKAILGKPDCQSTLSLFATLEERAEANENILEQCSVAAYFILAKINL